MNSVGLVAGFQGAVSETSGRSEMLSVLNLRLRRFWQKCGKAGCPESCFGSDSLSMVALINSKDRCQGLKKNL